MEMYLRTYVGSLAGLISAACGIVDDDEPPAAETGGTDGVDDEQVCLEAVHTLPELDCPLGYTPQLYYDGGGSTIIHADDPALAADLSVGLLIGFGAGTGADWVGYEVTRNSVCAFGCFIGCQPGQIGCLGDPKSGVCLLCDDAIDQQACSEFVSTCEPTDPGDDGGLDETGGGGDETGDVDTTGGMIDAPYDCTQWNPEAIRRPVPGGPFHLPQALVDELVQSNADALAECDGVRLRQASSGRWMISKMRSGSGGLLGALGLRVGDELAELDGVRLDSTDALLGMLGRFIDEDGGPRQFSPSHPGFALRVRRGEQELVVALRVGVSTAGDASGR